MNQVEKQILENIFDALDRLFDRECKVIDVSVLLYASEKALADSEIVPLVSYVAELEKLVRRGESEDIQREHALEITNELRVTLNEMLPI
ncbi:hypothetical protein ACJJIF_10770 [Microbulbifer sp. SSSA002]|uniref:hypothetical protein n=1 Tax=Microbulbifer sp. SSSA002 TaxID=3243376 RepID=UPI00403A50CB